jgi:hypothetical protein
MKAQRRASSARRHSVLACLVLGLLAAGCGGQASAAEGDDRPLPEVSWLDRQAVDSGGGHRGPWRMNASDYDYVDDPTVAIDERGQLGVAWVDQARKDVLFQAYGPDGAPRFEQPTNVSRSPEIFSWHPRVVFTGPEEGTVAILWQEIVFSGGSHGGEIFFARSVDGGQTFSAPINLSNTVAGAGKGRLSKNRWDNGSLDLVVGPRGHLFAAWTEYEGRLWVSRSTDGGETFSEPVHLAGTGDATPARGPSLAVSRAGTVYLAWAVGEDPAADVRVASSDDEGRSFTAPRVAVETGGHSDAPKLAVSREGVVHLVFAESDTGPGGRYQVRHTRAAGKQLEFEEPRELALEGAALGGSYPALGVDGSDNLYVLWEVFPGGARRPMGLGFALSLDGGRTFSRPSLVPNTAAPGAGFNGSQQGLLMRKLAVHPGGSFAVVNSKFRPNVGSEVWLIRGRLQAQ